jgi:hypothetical protein
MKGTEQFGTVWYSPVQSLVFIPPRRLPVNVEPVLMSLGKGVSVPGVQILSFYSYTITSVDRILCFPIYVFV